MSDLLTSYQENHELSMLWIFQTTCNELRNEEAKETREDRDMTSCSSSVYATQLDMRPSSHSLVIRPFSEEMLDMLLEHSRGKFVRNHSSCGEQNDSKYIKSQQSEQHCFEILCVLEGSKHVLNQMKGAVERSIAMTNGKRKVTEINPHSIAESLTMQHHKRGYNLALDGVRTLISHEKDSILHAFLLEGEFHITETLRTTGEFRPFLNDIQYYRIIHNPDYDVLLQERETQEAALEIPPKYAQEKFLQKDNYLEPIQEESTDDESISEEEVDEGINTSRHVVYAEPEIQKKVRKKKRVKVKQTKIVQGLSKSGSSRKAAKGDKSCENCTIM